jgi:HD-like signal output (HDOD) protein
VGRTVSTVEQAVSLLGMNTLRSLALTIGVFRDLSLAHRFSGFSAETLWGHCLRCGILARQIVLQFSSDKHLPEYAFTAGLLHDMGKLILLDRLPHEFQRTLTAARDNRRTWHEIETSSGEVTHTELGVYLLALWGLPMPIIDAVSLHHAPERIQSPTLNAAAAVYVANVLVQAAAPGQSGNGSIPILDQRLLERFHLVEHLDDWRKSAGQPAT